MNFLTRIPRFLAAFSVIALLTFISGCDDDPPGDPVVQPMTISGVVTDSNQTPLAGALILLDLEFQFSHRPESLISFSLPAADTVLIEEVSWCRDEIYRTRELDLPAGSYFINVGGEDSAGLQLTDQPLWIRMTTSAGSAERSIPVLRQSEDTEGDYGQWDYAFVRDQVRVQATTDANGEFEIENPCLGFGEELVIEREEGPDISQGIFAWRVRAWVYHSSYPDGTPGPWTEVDPVDGAQIDVEIQADGERAAARGSIGGIQGFQKEVSVDGIPSGHREK